VPTELDVATVNLWGLPWPAARARRERKRRFAQHLLERAYDVVGIQELWWPWHRSLALASLRLPRSRRDSGLAVAARLPVREDPSVTHFRHRSGPDRLKRKGVLRARVETEAGALALCVVHLQAGRRGAAVRQRQVAELLAGAAREPGPLLLLGDFNFHEASREDARSDAALAAAGFEDAALALGRPEPTYDSPSNPYVRFRPQSHRFDRVYLRHGGGVRLEPLDAEVVRVRPLPVSDHHPLRVRVRVAG
jgi:endonuclease/exonuclease/phosphatase family metal-dependent hydrolase